MCAPLLLKLPHGYAAVCVAQIGCHPLCPAATYLFTAAEGCQLLDSREEVAQTRHPLLFVPAASAGFLSSYLCDSIYFQRDNLICVKLQKCHKANFIRQERKHSLQEACVLSHVRFQMHYTEAEQPFCLLKSYLSNRGTVPRCCPSLPSLSASFADAKTKSGMSAFAGSLARSLARSGAFYPFFLLSCPFRH